MSTAVAPAPGVECSECLTHGHHMKAIEYVDTLEDAEAGTTKTVPLCLFCRDTTPCPGCAANDKERKDLLARVGGPEPPPRKKLIVKREKQPDVVPADSEPIREEPMPKNARALDDATIDKAIALRKDGLSTSKIAAKLNVKAYRLYQSSRFQTETRSLPHPNALRTERTHNKARSPRGAVATALKPAAVDAPLKAMREDCLEKIAKLQELVDAIDRVLAF